MRRAPLEGCFVSWPEGSLRVGLSGDILARPWILVIVGGPLGARYKSLDVDDRSNERERLGCDNDMGQSYL